MGELLIDGAQLALLTCTAVAIARQRNLLSTAMLAGIFSLLGAGWMLHLDAPDVAFTEAAVGAGMSTILILATLAVTTTEEKPGQASPLALAVVVLTGAVLVYGTLDMPRYGAADAPATRSEITRVYLESAQHPEEHGSASADEHDPDAERYHVGIPNVVTTVLASFRGYDTMGETAVIFTAGLGVLAILSSARRRRARPNGEVDIEPHGHAALGDPVQHPEGEHPRDEAPVE